MEITEVVLVDEFDNDIGVMEKLRAHELGVLHRAISVFVFNASGKLLLQRRALDKYHSPGLWTNTCCSHPFHGESAMDAANRRLKEEMGMEGKLIKVYDFIYKADMENGLIEHELDHVFYCLSDDEPVINETEVCEVKWLNESEITDQMVSRPDQFTAWFKIAFPELMVKLKELKMIAE